MPESNQKADGRAESAKLSQLNVQSNGHLGMFLDFIDPMWQSALEDPLAYESFCNDACGRFINFIPDHILGICGMHDIAWIKKHETNFGKPSDVYFRESTGF